MAGWWPFKKERPPSQDAIQDAERLLAYQIFAQDLPPSEVSKALTTLERAEKFGVRSEVLNKARRPRPKANDIDPWDFRNSTPEEGLLGEEHPGTVGIHYDTLRAMASTTTIAAIIQTRINQVCEFAYPVKVDDDLGFQIRLKDRDATPTEDQRKAMHEMESWMMSCGDERLGFETNLESFLRQLVRDSLTFDQACFEIVRTRGKGIAGFLAVDASTIRRAVPTEKEKERGTRDRDDRVAFVQVINNDKKASWSARDLAFCVRRPRTDIRIKGYGYPELEDLIRVVTGIINGESYNAANFTHGLHAAGVLALKSKMNAGTFRAFRRDFYAMMSGANNARKTPIIQLDPEEKEEIQSINLSQNNREMEFQQWMAYLQKLACAIYQIDPAELGFIYGNEGQSGSLAQEGPEARVMLSKEKGLRPLLRAIQVWLNRWIVSQIQPEFEFVFVGLDKDKKSKQLDMDIRMLQNFMTVNEIRARYDLELLEDPAADMIMSAAYISASNSFRDGKGGPFEESPEGAFGPGGEDADSATTDDVGDDGGVVQLCPECGRSIATHTSGTFYKHRMTESGASPWCPAGSQRESKVKQVTPDVQK